MCCGFTSIAWSALGFPPIKVVRGLSPVHQRLNISHMQTQQLSVAHTQFQNRSVSQIRITLAWLHISLTRTGSCWTSTWVSIWRSLREPQKWLGATQSWVKIVSWVKFHFLRGVVPKLIIGFDFPANEAWATLRRKARLAMVPSCEAEKAWMVESSGQCFLNTCGAFLSRQLWSWICLSWWWGSERLIGCFALQKMKSNRNWFQSGWQVIAVHVAAGRTRNSKASI